MDSDTEHRNRDGPASNAERLLPLHVAEYQALTNRNTYLIAIQYSFWPVIFLLTTLVAQLWTSGSDKIAQSALMWGGLLIAQVIAIVFLDSLREEFNNVYYIEHELMPKIRELLPPATHFWGYEKFLDLQRGKGPMWAEFVFPLLSLLLIAGAVALAPPATAWTFAGLAANLLLSACLLDRASAATRIRTSFVPTRPKKSSLGWRVLNWPAAVVGATIMAGILPVALICYKSGALLARPGLDEPLVTVPSVWFGDLVLLPIFNWLVVRFVARYKRDHTETATTAALSAAFLPAAIVAVVVNSYMHFIWTQDQYFGFIDPTPGKLSFAGWWHYGFSIVETVIVLMFIQIWLRADSSHKASARRGYQAWYVFLAYCLLSVADFTVLHWIILPKRVAHDYSGWTGWPGLLVIVFWFAISIGKNARARRPIRADA